MRSVTVMVSYQRSLCLGSHYPISDETFTANLTKQTGILMTSIIFDCMDWLSCTDLTNENGAIMLGNAEVKPNLSLAAKAALRRPDCLKRARNE